MAGREPVILARLGRRTGELADLLTARIREASVRTAAFLAALLPRLDPMAVRAAAGLLRDGVAVPASDLDAVHPGPATGAEPWHDHAAAPHIGEHETAGGFGPGWWPQATMPAPWPQATMPAGRPMAARPDVTRGRLIPTSEDLSALTVGGESPTVLAFVLAEGPGGVAYEVLNQARRAPGCSAGTWPDRIAALLAG